MKATADRQIHHRFGGGVDQLQHEHRRHSEHEHRQLLQRQLQPQTEEEHHSSRHHMDAEVALAAEAVDQPLGGVAKAGGQITGNRPGAEAAHLGCWVGAVRQVVSGLIEAGAHAVSVQIAQHRSPLGAGFLGNEHAPRLPLRASGRTLPLVGVGE